MVTEFVRKIKNSIVIPSNPIIERNGRYIIDNNEDGKYRYWISPLTSLDNNGLRLLIPDEFYNEKYLTFFLDKVPIPVRFYNLSSPYHDVVNDNYNYAKIFFSSTYIFKQPFTIANVTASYEDAAHPVTNIISDNPSDYYINNSGTNQTITIETVEVDTITGVTVYVEYDANTYTPSDFLSIQVSSDGVNWIAASYDANHFSHNFNVAPTITKMVKVYGNMNMKDTKYVRISIADGTKINKIVLHRDNTHIYNDKFYIKPVGTYEETFPTSVTTHLSEPTIFIKEYPANYTPGTVLKIDETIDLTEVPTDGRVILPMLDIHTRKIQIPFDVDKHLDGSLYATRNAIFYPARKLTVYNSYDKDLHDVKEVVVPNRGFVEVLSGTSFSFVRTTGEYNININSGIWKDGLFYGDYCTLQKSSKFKLNSGNEALSGTSRSSSTYRGMVTSLNIINKQPRHTFTVNGEIIYPGDDIDILPGDAIFANNIENVTLFGDEFLSTSYRKVLEWEQLDTLGRQYAISEAITLKPDEIPYEIVTEYYEPQLKVMLSIDGTNWYGIDRTTNTIRTYNNVDNTIAEINGFTLQEVHRILPNLKLLDTNYNNQVYFLFFLPYATAEHKTMHLWLRVLKGQEIRQIFSFDNGTTWKKYNPITKAFEDITFTTDDDAFNNATLVHSIPIQDFGTNTSVLIRYLYKSNYDFDIPVIKSKTRYITQQPKKITHPVWESSSEYNFDEVFNVLKKYGTPYNYLYRDGTFILSEDIYGKRNFSHKVYLLRGGYLQRTENLDFVPAKDLGINDGETIKYLVHLDSRDGVEPFKFKILGLEIMETGIGHGNNFTAFDTVKDLRLLKYMQFTRSATDVEVVITWNDNSTYTLIVPGYQQSINEVRYQWYRNADNFGYDIISDRTVFETEFDILNEQPTEHTIMKYTPRIFGGWPYDRYFYHIVTSPMKFIISLDGLTWYGLNGVQITNPGSFDEIKQNGLTFIDYLTYGIDNWKTLFGISTTATEQLIKIRNLYYPLSFTLNIKHNENEFIAFSDNTYKTINLKKFII